MTECDNQDYSFMNNASNNRKQTNRPVLILYGVLLLILLLMIDYNIINGNMKRITEGTDDCGNICHHLNTFEIKFQKNCMARDMTAFAYLKIDIDSRTCVESDYFEYRYYWGYLFPLGHVLNEYLPFVEVFLRDAHTRFDKIICMWGISTGLSLVFFLVLQYMATAFMWIVLVGTILTSIIASAAFADLAYGYYEEPMYIYISVGFGVYAIAITVITLAIRKYLEFVKQFFEQVSKAISGVPAILLEPILAIAPLITVWIFWLNSTIYIKSAGTPTELEYGKVTYVQDYVMQFSFWFNLFMTIWTVQFIYGYHDMVIGGIISSWYHARNRNKQNVRLVISTAHNIVRYHLGTILLGSLLMVFMPFINLFIKLIQLLVRYLKLDQYHSDNLEKKTKHFTSNAYVVTYLYGYGFYRAGEKAFNLIVNNILKMPSINSLVDFVLILAKSLITIICIGIAYHNDSMMFHSTNRLFVVAISSYMIASCFLRVYEMAIKTLIVCLCEDYETNDGIDPPHFMFLEFVEFKEKYKDIFDMKEKPKKLSMLEVQMK